MKFSGIFLYLQEFQSLIIAQYIVCILDPSFEMSRICSFSACNFSSIARGPEPLHEGYVEIEDYLEIDRKITLIPVYYIVIKPPLLNWFFIRRNSIYPLLISCN